MERIVATEATRLSKQKITYIELLGKVYKGIKESATAGFKKHLLFRNEEIDPYLGQLDKQLRSDGYTTNTNHREFIIKWP